MAFAIFNDSSALRKKEASHSGLTSEITPRPRRGRPPKVKAAARGQNRTELGRGAHGDGGGGPTARAYNRDGS